MELLEMCWRLKSRTSGRVIECGIYRTASAIELRCGYGERELLMSEVVPAVVVGRETARAWRRFVNANGAFEEFASPTGN